MNLLYRIFLVPRHRAVVIQKLAVELSVPRRFEDCPHLRSRFDSQLYQIASLQERIRLTEFDVEFFGAVDPDVDVVNQLGTVADGSTPNVRLDQSAPHDNIGRHDVFRQPADVGVRRVTRRGRPKSVHVRFANRNDVFDQPQGRFHLHQKLFNCRFARLGVPVSDPVGTVPLRMNNRLAEIVT